MAGLISQGYCKKICDYILGVSNGFATTETPYVTLSSTLPTATGTNVTEPNTGTNYGGFARQPFGPTSASGGSANNAAQITFPTPTTFGGFNANYFAIYSASVAGTMVASGTLTQALQCNLGIPVISPANSFTVSLTDIISGLTVAGANAVLDALTGKVASAVNFPAAMYLRWYTTTPTNVQAANLNEASYTGYTGVTTAGTIAAATTATPSVSTTSGPINSPACTAGTSTLVGWALAPAATGAGSLYVAGVCSSQVIGTGNQPFIASGVNILSGQ